MSKEWTTYEQASRRNLPLNFDDDGVIRTDDESELARIQAAYGEAGMGETLTEMEDLVDLGFRTE